MNRATNFSAFNKLVKGVSKRLLAPFEKIGSAGMSMIEIMIVVSLIAMLMAFLARNIMQNAERAKEDLARSGMSLLKTDLDRYKFENNKYPTTEQGLNALLTAPGGDARNWRGPYTEENKVVDPWKNPYGYESDGRTFRITSGGVDQEMGTADDLVYPEPKGGEKSQ
jgi:general secretion pathway protein G